jgi:predicted Zn-dependent peptidase
MHITTLANGLRVRHAQWQGGPLVVASLIVRGGASVDPPEKAGLARLTASLLTAGADDMSQDGLAERLAQIDATLQATTDLDTITLTVAAPKEQMREALDLLGTVMAAPAFPEVAIERERKKQIHGLQDLLNEPRQLSRATVRRLLYAPDSPYSSEATGLGTTSGIGKITRTDIADFHRAWFNPANSELVIVGAIGQTEAEAALAGTLGRWRSAGSLAPTVSVPERVAAPGIYLIDRPGMEQADLTVATLLDAPASPANAANAVMTSILGDSVAGRVNRNLREEKQWAFWASGSIEGGRAGQMLLIRTQVRIQQTAKSIAAIQGHLEGVKGSTPISSEELQLAKDLLTLSLPLGWETDEGIANAIATSIRGGLPNGEI